MSDHLDLPAAGQTYAGRLAAGVDVIPWGSAAAQEAVSRVCQEVAARCEQVIVTQAATETSDEDVETATLPAAGNSPETDDNQP